MPLLAYGGTGAAALSHVNKAAGQRLDATGNKEAVVIHGKAGLGLRPPALVVCLLRRAGLAQRYSNLLFHGHMLSCGELHSLALGPFGE